VQACAGTHCRSTGEIGSIKIIRIEHIQDGIERLEFAAGNAAISYMQGVEKLLDSAAGTLSVQRENLPSAVDRFFTEWKEQRKEIEHLRTKLAGLGKKQLSGDEINGVLVLVHGVDASPKELVSIATEFANDGGVCLVAGGDERIHVVVASGVSAVNASDVLKEVCGILGGRGGGKPGLAQGSGTDRSKLKDALITGKELITGMLNA